MFERFTDSARHVVVLAQQHARALNHNYIGTEHLLLGLVDDDATVAGKVLRSLGLEPDELRSEVEARVGRGSQPPSGHIPFTPPAKKVLSLALREALDLGHNSIGTEHLLLGILREGEGVGAQVLDAKTGGLHIVRGAVIQELSKGGGESRPVTFATGMTARIEESRRAIVRPAGGAEMPVCPSCGASLSGSLGYRVVEATEHGGDGTRSVLFLYCMACGNAIDNWMLPEDG